MPTDLDRRERGLLCDLLGERGPEAPTLCGDWTTADLAAHLVVRERRPDAAPGILLGGRFEGRTERLMARELRRHGYEGTIERIRGGPPPGPFALRPLARPVNTVEYVVHHEDVRRPAGLGPRPDDQDLQDGVWGLLGWWARALLARAGLGPAGVRLESAGHEPIVARRAGSAGEARLTGDPVELLLHLYGRGAAADVEVGGDAEAVARLDAADLGI